MAALFFVLALLSCTRADDVTASSYCFPEGERIGRGRGPTLFHNLGASQAIKLELQNWMTHGLNTRIAEILLREKLGFDVEVFYFADESQSGGAAYRRLNESKVDMNIELWPHHHQSIRDDIRLRGQIQLGQPTGFMATTGWFIQQDSLASVHPVRVAYVSNASSDTGAIGPTIELDQKEFMRAMPQAAQTLLVKARSFSKVDVCDARAVQNHETDGVYNCRDGTWTRHGISCAPHNEPLNGRLPCPALVHYNPDWDTGQIEGRLADMKLDLELVFQPGLNALALQNWSEPLFIHNYNPSPLITGSCRNFLHVKVANGVPIGFPDQYPEIGISLTFLRSASHKTRPAKVFAERFAVNNSAIERMQGILARMQADQTCIDEPYREDLYFAAACAWLKETQNLPGSWTSWLQPEDSDMAYAACITLIVMVLSIAYTLDASYRFYFGECVVLDAVRFLFSPCRRGVSKDGNIMRSPATDGAAPGSAADNSSASAGVSTVAWAQDTFSCHVDDGEVAIHLVRYGDISLPAIATVSTEDGQYAKFGRHYMQIHAEGSPPSGARLPRPYSIFRPHPGDTSQHPARAAEVHFKAGQRSAFAKVVVVDVKQVAAVREFGVRLVAARSAKDSAPINCEPHRTATVRIADTARFPNCFRLRFPQPPIGEQLKSARDLLRMIVRPQNTLGSIITSRDTGFKKSCAVLLDRLALARNFVIAMAKFEGHWTFWWHMQALFNAAANFTDSWLFARLLDSVLGETGHPNWGYTLAFAKMATFWLRYRVSHFVPPTYGAMIDLKNLLTRKFLSLSDQQLQSLPHLESRYMHAITNSSEAAWVKVFNDYHGLYFAVYRFISSVAYILFTVAGSSGNNRNVILLCTVLLLLGTFALHLCIQCCRVWKQMDYGHLYDSSRHESASWTYHICRDWRLIRLYGIESEVSRQAAALRNEFNGHDFWMWLYSERTSMIAGTLQELIVCVLWMLAYSLTAPQARSGEPILSNGDFLTVLSNFSFFSASVGNFTGLFAGYGGLFRTSFTVEEVAELLNVGLDSDCAQGEGGTAASGEPPVIFTGRAGNPDFDSARQSGAVAQLHAALDSPSEGRISFIVRAITFSHAPTSANRIPDLLFDALRIDGATEGQYLPTGLIGLQISEAARAKPDGLFAAQAEATFLDLLAGACPPAKGLCAAVPMSRVVPVIAAGLGAVVEGTLFDNLYFASKDVHREQSLPEEKLWSLCKHVGLSEMLLGKSFEEDWSKVHISSFARRLSGSDLFKLMLARALVQQPRVLLVGGAVSLADQNAIAPILRAFLDGSLDDIMYGGRPVAYPPASRAVVWNASKPVLIGQLRRHDHVLTLESPQRAVLSTAGTAFASEPGAGGSGNSQPGPAMRRLKLNL